ncbi:MAG: prepilin peptidase, partial [Halobacteriota archaeon]
PGRLLETPDGFDRRGLDLDALRMYLNWRDATVADLRSDPARFRERGPDDPGDPGDGAIADGGAVDDPWAAEAFIEAVGHEPYGTSAETLRQGLELIATRDRVWYSPGIPFVALLALGLAVALGFGDIYSVLLAAVGVG